MSGRSARRLFMAGLSVLLAACGSDPGPADLVLRGGPVVTLSDAGVVEAIAVQGERIVAVGSTSGVRAFVGPETRVVELDGRSVIPGLGDNHFHSIGGGPGVDLSRTRSIDDVLGAIADRAAATPVGEVIVTNSNCTRVSSPTSACRTGTTSTGRRPIIRSSSCGRARVRPEQRRARALGDRRIDRPGGRWPHRAV